MGDYRRIDFKDKGYYFIGKQSTLNAISNTINNMYAKASEKLGGFSNEYYDRLIANRDYSAAARYGRMFHMEDPMAQLEHQAQMRDIERKGRYINTLYANALDKKQEHAIDFTLKVFQDGGMESIDDYDNEYKKKFEDFKRRLGSSGTNRKDVFGTETGNDYQEADRISITFDKQKQYFLGIDFLSKDNENTLQNFLDRMGYNADSLREQGVEVTDRGKASEGTITIDKNNPLFNKLIYDIVTHKREFGGRGLGIKGFKEGKQISNYDIPNDFGIGRSDNPDFGKNERGQTRIMKDMFDVINDAKANKEYIENASINRTYSSLVYGYASPHVGELIQQKQGLKGEELNAINDQIKTAQQIYHDQLMGGGLTQHDIYSNYYNDDITEELLSKVDVKQKQELRQLISEAFDGGRAIYQFMEFDGRFGTLVTLPATVKKTLVHSVNGKASAPTNTIQVFVEGLFAKEAQERAAGDYTYIAMQEMDDMRKFNIQYKTQDETEIGVDKLADPNLAGTTQEAWYIKQKGGEKQYIDTTRAKQIVEQDKAEESLFTGLASRHINKNGDIIDQNALEKDIKDYTAVIINSIYPETSPIMPDDILGADRTKVSASVYDKLSEAEKVYYSILYRFKSLM